MNIVWNQIARGREDFQSGLEAAWLFGVGFSHLGVFAVDLKICFCR
jgi:hypothetical protein